ncbi:hypothetical protein ACFL3T_05305, partial [Patescibacteria group bacterium]
TTILYNYMLREIKTKSRLVKLAKKLDALKSTGVTTVEKVAGLKKVTKVPDEAPKRVTRFKSSRTLKVAKQIDSSFRAKAKTLVADYVNNGHPKAAVRSSRVDKMQKSLNQYLVAEGFYANIVFKSTNTQSTRTSGMSTSCEAYAIDESKISISNGDSYISKVFKKVRQELKV